jgi:hypothetical protein
MFCELFEKNIWIVLTILHLSQKKNLPQITRITKLELEYYFLTT